MLVRNHKNTHKKNNNNKAGTSKKKPRGVVTKCFT